MSLDWSWLVAPDGCYESNLPPGSCVPPGGLEVIVMVLLLGLLLSWLILRRPASK